MREPGPPRVAAWLHRGARSGFEVLFAEGRRFDGHATAVEQGVAWSVRYAIEVDDRGIARRARVEARWADGSRGLHVEADGAGGWTVDGRPAPALDGCLDVDLEASAFTNAFPVGRLRLGVGAGADAPAAYVRAPALAVERLEQRYTRLEDDPAGRRRYDYVAPAFHFRAVLVYDADGLVADYPGIAVRVR